jgi:hypothetical protein
VRGWCGGVEAISVSAEQKFASEEGLGMDLVGTGLYASD